jgi:Acetyl-CoA dehydrogenase C-terminal like
VAADKLPGAAGEDAAFYQAKRTTAAFYVDRILPQVGALLYAIKSGKTSMMALEEAAF